MSWIKLVKPSDSKSKSKIWTHFANPVYEDESGQQSTDKDNAVCDLCKKMVKNNKGTKNLWFHIQRHHPREYSSLNRTELSVSESRGSQSRTASGTCSPTPTTIPILLFFISLNMLFSRKNKPRKLTAVERNHYVRVKPV